MEENFKKWVAEKEGKANNTVYSYAKAIGKISQHYSQYKGIPLDIFKITDVKTIDDLIPQYDFGGKYEEFGNKGKRTYINSLKTYSRFLNNTPKQVGQRLINSKTAVEKNIHNKEDDVFNHFNQKLKDEALQMSHSYKLFYGLEASIRDLIKTTMEDWYGQNWWHKVDDRVKDNVKNHLAYELDMPHSKRSENNIDYTTFGDLRKIMNSNWPVFESKFERNLNSVNEVMIDLNRIRVSIAHCTPLVQKEVNRLEIRIDDWFGLLKS